MWKLFFFLFETRKKVGNSKKWESLSLIQLHLVFFFKLLFFRVLVLVLELFFPKTLGKNHPSREVVIFWIFCFFFILKINKLATEEKRIKNISHRENGVQSNFVFYERKQNFLANKCKNCIICIGNALKTSVI